jgi:YidC/Oxa1 family membrane protein insertase
VFPIKGGVTCLYDVSVCEHAWGVKVNIKEWIRPVVIAVIVALFVQYFIVDRILSWVAPKKVEQTGFIAPHSQEACKPLRTDIDFLENEKKRPELLTEVRTEWGIACFSSHGAVLDSLDFNHLVDHTQETIRTIYSHDDKDRQLRCFLVALEIQTPYYYELVSHEDMPDTVIVQYRAPWNGGMLIKTFTIHKYIHKIDMSCTCTVPIVGGDIRIMYPAPRIADIAKRDTISAILINNQNTFERIAGKELNTNQGWFAPAIFGAENLYFMHVLCADKHNFVQRAYFHRLDDNQLISVLEGSANAEPVICDLSFYCGPRSDDEVQAVDSRLEKANSYAGFLAPLSKLFFKILIFLFRYVQNYGIAIILLTLMLKIALFPLTVRGESRMKEGQEISKKMQYLKQRHKDNPELLAQEQAALIKKHGLAGLGCLTVFLQIPVLLAMRTLLANTVQLYHAPFMWIPDLAVYDPYYILPVLFVCSMYAQALVADKTQRMMVMGVGLVIGAAMAHSSAGLVLYFVTYGFLTMLQTKLVRYFNWA